MAMTANFSTNHHSPLSPITPGGDGDGVSSPKLPWAQVVRGTEPVSISAIHLSPSLSTSSSNATVENLKAETQLESSDGSSNGNVGGTKKPVWNKQNLNGVVELNSTVMGGGTDSWPALSESTRPTHKLVPHDSSKPVSDKSDSVYQGPIISHTPQEEAKTNTNPNFTPNNTIPARQKSLKNRSSGGGAGVGLVQGGFNRPPAPPPLPPPFPVFEMSYGGMATAIMDSAGRDPLYKGGVGSQSSPRINSRRGNFGPRPFGDGVHHNGHGGRHDQEREWNGPRGSNLRDVHVTQQMVPPPRRFIRSPPPGPPPFIAPPPVRHYANPMAFEMMSPYYYVPTLPPDSFRGVPLVAHAPPPPPPLPLPLPLPMLFPVLDPLPALIVNQIDYYFSEANLARDQFLRSNMDDQGWVPITLIAGFHRVQHLTSNIQLILDSLRASTVVEVQGDKVRRHNDWKKWILGSAPFPTETGSQLHNGSTDKVLADTFQKVSLDEVTNDQTSNMGATDNRVVVPGRFSPEDLTGQSSLANGKGAAEESDSGLV